MLPDVVGAPVREIDIGGILNGALLFEADDDGCLTGTDGGIGMLEGIRFVLATNPALTSVEEALTATAEERRALPPAPVNDTGAGTGDSLEIDLISDIVVVCDDVRVGRMRELFVDARAAAAAAAADAAVEADDMALVGVNDPSPRSRFEDEPVGLG